MNEYLNKWLAPRIPLLLILFFGVLTPLILFASFATELLEGAVFSFDQPILLFAHHYANPVLDALAVSFTWAGSGYVLVPIGTAIFSFLWLRQRRLKAAFWVLGVGGAALLNLLAKQSFARVRPGLWISIMPESTFSFPSGHAMGAMAFVCALVALTWHTRWRALAITAGALFVVMVGMARVYLGVHYPSDILAGWSASFAWVIGLRLIFARFWSPPGTQAAPVM